MRAWGRRLAFVLQFYTVIPVRARLTLADADCAWSLALAPLAGLVIGVLSGAAYWALARLTFPLAAAAGALFALTFLSGAMHLDGLADTCDGIFCRKDAKTALEIMKDSRTGAFGVLGLIFFFLMEFALLGGAPTAYYFIDVTRLVILMPVFARLSMTVAAASAGPAREDGMGRAFILPCGWPQALMALLCSIIICALVDASLLAAAPIAALWGFLCARFFHRRFGGLTGDLLGAVCTTGEIISLLLITIIKAV